MNKVAAAVLLLAFLVASASAFPKLTSYNAAMVHKALFDRDEAQHQDPVRVLRSGNLDESGKNMALLSLLAMEQRLQKDQVSGWTDFRVESITRDTCQYFNPHCIKSQSTFGKPFN